jgi:hypothetical protein
LLRQEGHQGYPIGEAKLSKVTAVFWPPLILEPFSQEAAWAVVPTDANNPLEAPLFHSGFSSPYHLS